MSFGGQVIAKHTEQLFSEGPSACYMQPLWKAHACECLQWLGMNSTLTYLPLNVLPHVYGNLQK